MLIFKVYIVTWDDWKLGAVVCQNICRHNADQFESHMLTASKLALPIRHPAIHPFIDASVYIR